MSDWDDMFNAAAGVDQPKIESTRRRLDTSSDGELEEIKPRKKKSKKCRVSAPSNPLQSFLDSRMHSIEDQIWDKLPSWLSVGHIFCSRKVCSQWSPTATSTSKSLDAKCINCNHGLLHHSLTVIPSTRNKSASDVIALEAFTMVRNIRSCCSCVLELSCSPDVNNSRLKDYARNTVLIAKQLAQSNLSSMLPRGEADILDRKFQSIETSANNFKVQMKAWCKTKKDDQNKFKLKGVFNELVQLIIDCDAAYFRIYYLQNSGIIPLRDVEVFIPHPPTYFGTNNLSWRTENDCIENFFKFVKADSALKKRDWEDILEKIGIVQGKDLESSDPLSFMQQNRMAESILIFWKSGWLSSEDARKEMKESVYASPKADCSDSEDEFYDKHQTPAPCILQSWRDSSRDLLCNLYAYATLSPQELKGIVALLSDMTVTSVIEMGAGTGYISHMFQESGIHVSAFDIAPTTASGQGAREANEYHGLSPSYFTVNQAESKDIPALLRNKYDVKKVALLLCYAPPLTSMAEDAVKMFVKCGGEVLIHIGEFKGLTASTVFETYLIRNFCLKHRVQCLHWGTDAAEATVWVKKSKMKDSISSLLLLPCSHCLRNEGRKRFKALRQFVYCSSECFEQHSKTRNVSSWFSFVPDMGNEGENSFEDANACLRLE